MSAILQRRSSESAFSSHDGVSLTDQRSTLDRIRAIYATMWGFCAGWNRCSFRAAQLRHILTHFKIDLHLSPLGSLDAVTTRVDDVAFVSLNRTLIPDGLRLLDGRSPHLLEWIGSPAGSRARFVLLHELAHVYIHPESPGFWREAALDQFEKMKWIEEQRIMHRLDDSATFADIGREAEADFVALVAMIPDFVLWQIEQREERLEERSVVNYLLKGSDDSPDGRKMPWLGLSLASIAKYRILLYRRFAHIFRAASSTAVLDANGKRYRKIDTIECVGADELRKANDVEGEVDFSEIVTTHPRAIQWPGFREAVERGEYRPFDAIAYLEDVEFLASS